VQTSLASYEIALDLKNNASIMKWGEVRQSPFDRFPKTNSEVANSGVAKNRVVRRSDDTCETAAIRYPYGGLPCNPGPTGCLSSWRVIPFYDGALVGNYGERENLRNVDLCCKLLTEGNGKDCNTSGCARLERI
jgi:hypothetical protein